MSSDALTLTARYLLPVQGGPIPNGRVVIERGRIAAIEPATGRSADIDLGNAAIVPGFVNAHTHLDLEWIEPLGPIEDEIDWLRRVVVQRRATDVFFLPALIEENLSGAIRNGTTLVADMCPAGLSWPMVARAPIRGVVFAEVIGLRRERGLETSQAAWDWISSVRPEDQVAANCRVGLAPHAPYSTAGWLYHRVVGDRLPLTTHLAEMPEELELLTNRTGRLRHFLEEVDAWDEEWEPLSPRPADYVRRGELRQADWLIAHGNYLEAADFWQLRPEAAPDDQRVAVAYCPRTHARFGHAPHPYRAMLERGVVVCLGTDSLASSPSLSVLDEIRFLARQDPQASGPLLLAMGTLFGAWALRAEKVTGSLEVGKSADLAAIALPDAEGTDPYRLLLDSDLPVLATMIEGRFVFGPGPLERPAD